MHSFLARIWVRQDRKVEKLPFEVFYSSNQQIIELFHMHNNNVKNITFIQIIWLYLLNNLVAAEIFMIK